ncbi:putative iron compound ABC transporter permease protein [Methanocella paludicola SANAE]|uniref:Cobalamin import system permease protein BtuC n=1 Tax=Methanocella paludicola (strain DSM 17711 / JCM 13418 / NBRC 101707 / SANAE) TaxID=304371 RepID=D1YZJ0_METPS|nr:iron ABC transporter permease [Methanocella paludicola]BAI61862.1 putative iron compound ABC transporter permease protein [Methanocella paludicola SANAE]
MEGQASLKEAFVSEIYREGHAKKVSLLIALFILLVVASIYSVTAGSASISISDVGLSIGHAFIAFINGIFTFVDNYIPFSFRLDASAMQPGSSIAESIVVNMRLPRILLAILTGISLAVAGAVMQGILRNPLVSPFTLGLASASSFGAALAIVFGAGLSAMMMISDDYVIVISAFAFGLLSMFLIYGISRMRGTGQATLILAGVVIGYIFQAGVLVFQYLSNNERLKDIVMWLMGGMWSANWDTIVILAPITLICVLLLSLISWDLNALSAGDDIAKSLGIRVERLRLICLFLTTLIASSCLAFTGVIGFIGLMAPHICRMLIGNDYRYLLPCSALTGAIILLVSDTFARTIVSPIELPVGIIMYIIGGIFFLFLILRGKESHIY